MSVPITLRVNGVDETVSVEPNATLLQVLRDALDLTGAKEGCNEGECGACVVLLDGKAVNSCLVLAVAVGDQEVTTIEGLPAWFRARTRTHARLHPVQEAFLSLHAVQCGFCTPGMIMTAAALLAEHPDPTEPQVRDALAGNLCRCTGYRQILDAIEAAARVARAATGEVPS